jgi:hypothetical protein
MKLRQALANAFLLASLAAVRVAAHDFQDPCTTYTPECAKQQQERIRQAAGVTSENPKPAQPHALPKPSPQGLCGAHGNISKEFREVAGDALDKTQSLDVAMLKGQFYYEPVLHEADLAVVKTQRNASSSDEKQLANCIESYKVDIELIRVQTESQTVIYSAQTQKYIIDGEKRHKATLEAIRASLQNVSKASGETPSPIGQSRVDGEALTKGKLLIASTPADAEIYLDDGFVGNSPATLSLATGNHNVRISSKGYKDWVRQISVLSGSDLRLVATLEKLK